VPQDKRRNGSSATARTAAAILVAACLAAGGCMTSRSFLLPGQTEKYRVFDYHYLRVLISNTLYDSQGKTYQVYIAQEYRSPYPELLSSDTVGVIRIDSLCLKLDTETTARCPELQETRHPSGPLIQEGVLFGPAYSWGVMDISDRCTQIDMTFTAVLQDRASGEVLQRQPVVLRLAKERKKVGSFLR